MRVNTNSFGMYPTEELTLEGKENLYYVESIIDRKEETDENVITRIRRRLFHTLRKYTVLEEVKQSGRTWQQIKGEAKNRLT